MQWLMNNWTEIMAIMVALVPLLDIIVRLTPTKKDDTLLGFVKKFLDKFFPNRKKGGGTHEL